MNGRRSKLLFLACALTAGLPTAQLQAEPSQIPMFLGGAIEPNVMFTLDDSGSMQWELMPDALLWSYFVFPRPDNVYHDSNNYINFTVSFEETYLEPVDPDLDPAPEPVEKFNIYDRWARSSAINKNYYNPEVTYIPWSKADGSLMDPADPECAPHNPVKDLPVETDVGNCRKLTDFNTQSASWDTYEGKLPEFPAGAETVTEQRTFWPAVYYNYKGEDFSDTEVEKPDNYVRVVIDSDTTEYTGGGSRTDCIATPPNCTYGEEIQNFANWYTYYRSRILLARAGVGRAFSEQGSSMRVGFAAINQGLIEDLDGAKSPGAVINGVRVFTEQDRIDFFTSLYEHQIPTLGTPLRSALDNVGKYFSRTDNKGPWGKSPGSDVADEHLTCRQSYNILMTDGYWNGPALTETGGVDATNADNESGLSISGPAGKSYQYSPIDPYRGVNEGDKTPQNHTLADVGMYYWNRDLRPNLKNEVPVNFADEAFWQHLVNFTVGLGVSGTLDPDDEDNLDGLTNGTKFWPMPSATGEEENIDDLWHTAVNSRGGFYSAADPDEFSRKLSDSLKQIIGRAGSSASIATNSTRLNAGTFIYQARFDSDTWLGQLLGFKVDESNGDLIDAKPATAALDPIWEAGGLLDSRAKAREIFTHDADDSDGPGVVFEWGSLSETFKAFLNTGPSGPDPLGAELGEERLEFLHGDRTMEQASGGPFRDRRSILSDIVNSDPFFVGKQDYGYNLLPGDEGTKYVTYRASSAYKNRVGMVYVGANDGMLHAFSAETGEELFAFIPESLLPDLWKLTDPDYSHNFYVDGASVGKDVYIGGGWTTVLLGTTGAGGRSIFALEVDDPTSFEKEDVLWEFNSDNDGDLGYTIGEPSIVRLANGEWGAVFGNGYNSVNNRAVLFIVNVFDGSLIAKIDTEVGDATKPNGLSGPLAVDTNGDRIADRVYAGDLHGNMWAFDISDTDEGKWAVAYGSNTNPAPLFTALDENDNPQPITAKPDAGKHPSGGLLVFFGTGKYFEYEDGSKYRKIGDDTVIRKNSFYGIRDDFSSNNPSPISGRDDLLPQVITHETYDDVSSGESLFGDGDSNTPDFLNPFPWDLRLSTEEVIDWNTHSGWYMDLRSPINGWEGERSVSKPLLLDQRVVFTTVIPSDDPCAFGGTSWLMELSSVDGARLSVTPFDLNGDDVFNQEDYVVIDTGEVDVEGNPIEIKIPVSGKKSKVGIIKTPAIVKTKEKEFKYTSGSSGDIEKTLESRSYREGRQSWRQMR